MVAAALDVDSTEVDHAAEALREVRPVAAGAVSRHRYLEQNTAQLVVDLLVVAVLRLRSDAPQQWA
jgi:hypothetical protein